MEQCPTCGQPIRKVIDDPDDLLRELQAGTDRRDVYRSVNGTWHLTRTKNITVAKEAVYELLKYGKIVRTYSNCDDCYCIGPTIDVEATIERRKRKGRRSPPVYVHEKL